MLIVTSTTDLIQVVTTAAVATHVQASWVDNNAGAITPGRTNTIVSTATTTTVVAAPGAGVQRNVRLLTIRAVGGAQGVTVQHTDGTTVVQMLNVALLSGESIVMDELGFQVMDASGALKTAASPNAGRFIKTTVYITGSGNHTTDPKTASIFVRMVGGGGGGGGTTLVAVSAAVGGGGGSGGYLEKTVAVQPSTAYAYACGALGGGGAATGATGTAGGNSTLIVAGTTYTANGGAGGIGQTGGTALAGVLGGAGGAVSTNGDLNGAGMCGGYASRFSGLIAVSGCGGCSDLGSQGGNARNTQGAGNPGIGPGAGGGGGCTLNGGAAVTGGAGIAGAIIINEFA